MSRIKSEAPKDKGRAEEGYRQRFGRLYVNSALNHIRIIVIGSLFNLPRQFLFCNIFLHCGDEKSLLTLTMSLKQYLHVADKN